MLSATPDRKQLLEYFYLRNILRDGDRPGRQVTFSAGEESEESAGVTPAEPVPGLDETLVLWLGEQPGDEVGPEVGEPGVVHVAGNDDVGPVTLAQGEGRVQRLQENIF